MEDTAAFIILLVFGLLTGIRHGVDIDHIAAITDIVGSQSMRSRGLLYSMLYATGHGVMVILLGLLVILTSQSLPEAVDRVFGKFVGATLILLGLYVAVSLIQQRSNFKMKSRWMLIFSAIKFGYHKFLHNFKLSHQHPKLKAQKYQPKSAFGIGLIHGVGAETPTQISALATLLGIGGGVKAGLFLLFFVAGILISNLAVAVFSSAGAAKLKQKRKIYVGIGLLTGLFSLVVGVMFLIG